MLQAGAILNNRYQIEKLVGQGGMGAVYRATDTRLNKPVAIKQFTGSAADQHIFTHEAMLLARLRHPSVVPVTDYFVEGGGLVPFLVMEWLEGTDVNQLLKKGA